MNRDYQLSFCKRCVHHKFDPQKGIVCGLTGNHADFLDSCGNYENNGTDLNSKSKRELNTNSTKSWSYLAIVLFIGVIGIVLFKQIQSFSQEKAIEIQFESFTQEDYIKLGNLIESYVEKGEYFKVNELMNYDHFCKKSLSGLYEKSFSKNALCSQIEDELKLGSIAYEISWDYGNFEFLKYYLDEDIPHLIFRSFGNESIKYQDYEIGVTEGELVINDAFDYDIGSLYSEYFFNLYSLDRGLNIYDNQVKLSDYKKTARIINEIYQELDSENYILAMEKWNSIPESMNKRIFSMNIKIQIASNLDIDTYMEVCQEFVSIFPENDELVVMLDLILYSALGDSDFTSKSITKLNEFVGDDKLLIFYEGIAHFNNLDFGNALLMFNKVNTLYPELKDVKLRMYLCLIQLNKIDEAEELKSYLVDHQMFSSKEIETILLSINESIIQ